MKFERAIVITGGIATGKSAVSAILREFGYEVIDADAVAHDVLDMSKDEICAHFGTRVMSTDGKVDRKALGEIVFSDSARMSELEAIVSPKIRAQIHNLAKNLEKKGKIYFVDIPLYFEKREQYADFARVATVTADKDTQIARLMARNGLTEAQARARIALQMDTEKKAQMSDYVIANDGNLDDLHARVAEWIENLGDEIAR